MTTQTTMRSATASGPGIDRQPVGGAPRFPAQARQNLPAEPGSLVTGSAVYSGRWVISRDHR